jgi:hypothetical protein
MRGRGKTREPLPRNPDAPWETPIEPEEEVEKVLPLPVPPPPPSSTNTRLKAMDGPLPDTNKSRQTASGNFSAHSGSAALRQSVRYKPGANPAIERPKMVDPGPMKKKRRPNQAPNMGTSYGDNAGESPRVRVNPKLLKPTHQGSQDSAYDDEDDERPVDRYSKLAASDSAAFSWSEMQHVVTFYFREVWSLLINPRAFFYVHAAEETLSEPIAFMILSGGIAAVFLTLSGALGDAISTLFGTAAFTIIATLAAHYCGQYVGEPDCDLKTCFKILAYAQAPLLVSWIKLGSIPAGWLCAIAYSMYLTMAGLEEVFGMERKHAIMIAAILAVVLRGLLHLIGL